MTEEYIYNTALAQSAVDLGCSPDDFIKNENTVVPSRRHYGARKYLSLPFVCNLVTYGAGVVASVTPELENVIRSYTDRFHGYRCFETPRRQRTCRRGKTDGLRRMLYG